MINIKHLILGLTISLGVTSVKARAMKSTTPSKPTGHPTQSQSKKPTAKKITSTTTPGTKEMSADELYSLGLRYYNAQGVPRDYKKAAKNFSLAADKEHVDAQYMLGTCYAQGNGVPQNDTTAIKCFAIAAEHDHTDAQFKLGQYLAKTKNFEEAVKWYQKAAEKGHVGAQNSLGLCFKNGHGVPKDPVKAFEYFTQAATKDHPDAQYNLGVCFERGFGVARDISTAATWYQKAAEKGHVGAQNSLGLCFKNGYGVPKDPKRAFELFNQAATKGHPDAQYNLGVCFEQGFGVPISIRTAAHWYEEAANKKHLDAQNRLGLCLKNGHGVPKDLSKAFALFEQAASKGHPDAQYNLGVCFEKGICTSKNLKTAIDWFTKAATQDHIDAQFQLGQCFTLGLGVKRNYTEAVKWFRPAAEKGHIEAQFNLGQCFANGTGIKQDYAEAARWFIPAAEHGHVDAQFILGQYFANGQGVKQDYTESARWFRLAAIKGNTEAQLNLGQYLVTGKGVEKNYKEAAKWFRPSAEKGNIDAQFNLGLCFTKLTPPNYSEAIKWFKPAAEKGHIEAQAYLGQCLTNIVPPNYTEAVKWLRSSADHDHAIAQYNLGKCYLYGNGVLQNDFAAIDWMEKAAANGCDYALNRLGLFFFEKKDYEKAFKYFKQAAESRNPTAQYNLGTCYVDGKGTTQDIAEGARWLYMSKANEKANTDSLQAPLDPIEKAIKLFNDFEKLKSDTTSNPEFITTYFGKHLDRLTDFLKANEITMPIDKALLKRKIESQAIDLCELNKLLTEAYDALNCAKYALSNAADNEVNQKALDEILEILSEKDLDLSANPSDIALTDTFLYPYVLPTWRSLAVPDDDSNDYGILANIFGAGFSRDLIHCETVSKGENIYDYIFGEKGKFVYRFYILCKKAPEYARSLLAREMYWLRTWKEKYDANLLTEEMRKAYEKCRNLVEAHFVSARGECHNELADIMILWASDIDKCESDMGIGVRILDQRTFDERFTTAYRQILAEKVLSNNYIGDLVDTGKASEIVKHLWKSLNSLFGPEYRNFYRFLVAHLLNVIPAGGSNLVADAEITEEDIATIISEAIDLKDMCKISQDMFQSLADEKDAQADDSDCSAQDVPIKEKLMKDIESTYKVSFEEFCSLVDKTCGGDFQIRLECFLTAFEETKDPYEIETKSNINAWVDGKQAFTVRELIDMISGLDLMGENAPEIIPELFRFNCAISSRDPKAAEYYAKVLYPIYLLKAGLIKINKK